MRPFSPAGLPLKNCAEGTTGSEPNQIRIVPSVEQFPNSCLREQIRRRSAITPLQNFTDPPATTIPIGLRVVSAVTGAFAERSSDSCFAPLSCQRCFRRRWLRRAEPPLTATSVIAHSSLPRRLPLHLPLGHGLSLLPPVLSPSAVQTAASPPSAANGAFADGG